LVDCGVPFPLLHCAKKVKIKLNAKSRIQFDPACAKPFVLLRGD